MVGLVSMQDLLRDVQMVIYNIWWHGGLSRVFTFVIADFPNGIVIILRHQNYSPGISYLQHYPCKLGWKFKHLIGNEDRLSSWMPMQVLSQGVLLDCSGNSDYSPGWR